MALGLACSAGAAAGTETVFLNRCPASCTYFPGPENSTNNTSSIIGGTRTLAAFAHAEPLWQEVVACVQRLFEPFDVVVTDVDPAPASHHEIAVAGTPEQLGFPGGTAGISPFACDVIPNSIAFAFANVHAPSADEICWTVAHEAAHTYGLDHLLFAPDPMTYLAGCLPKLFAASARPCGESTPRLCCTNAATQDSFAALELGMGAGAGLFREAYEDDGDAWLCHWSQVEPPPPPGGTPLRALACGTEIGL